MASLLPTAGLQSSSHRRLSRLYNDTKKSSDFVKELAQNEGNPGIKSLRRKLRIQKDRLMSWGLEWSDPNQSTEIDESLSRAGLSEVVGSIMSTIKEILAEAEPLWQSSNHINQSRPSSDLKAPLVQWDQSRFEDLVRDLTASIDTLYDLSRSRSSGRLSSRVLTTSFHYSATDKSKPFESSRMQTLQPIDPATLIHLPSKQQTDGPVSPREVVLMSSNAYMELMQSATVKESLAPLLLEYATFDSIYSGTGIMPPISRFEKLSSGLQHHPHRVFDVWTGLPRLLGYFEDIDNSRIGLVYRFPPSFTTTPLGRSTTNPPHCLVSLSDLIRHHGEPPLEAKFRLAYNLANTVFDMHARGIAHGNLNGRSISFWDTPSMQAGVEKSDIDIRRPLVSSFDVFPEDYSIVQLSPWRHPLDPRNSKSTHRQITDERVLDLYSLAMALLSIGLWTELEHLVVDSSSEHVSMSCLDSLRPKCGTLYVKAVQACWNAVDDEFNGRGQDETVLSRVQVRSSTFLETCCALDGVSGAEQYLIGDSREFSSAQQSPKFLDDIQPPSHWSRDEKSTLSRSEPSSESKQVVQPDTKPRDVSGKQKMRCYPHALLASDIVEKWNTVMMPQINQALRHFYRGHPESVEISLESIGPTLQAAQPTVLVVCTSVGQVRAILKKRLGQLLDDTTGFSLKVCRGRVVRSRRLPSSSVPRSMACAAHGDEDQHFDVASNPGYQLSPQNGASIGAWVGSSHLPPVSFGGLVLLDGKPYGMTVHHMLEDPEGDTTQDKALRSSAAPDNDSQAEYVEAGWDDDAYGYEISETESEYYSETDITGDCSDSDGDGDDDGYEQGDILGVEPGCGEGFIITQPAFDDVDEAFYPCADARNEDHIDTFRLGEIYASSGLRRKQVNGLVHEIDWALIEFEDCRRPQDNSIPCLREDMPTRNGNPAEVGDASKLQPTTVAPSSSLPGREVQCMARTSGSQSGRILQTLTSVRIFGRCSPSHTYQVASMLAPEATTSTGRVPIGVPGDSGAWIVDRHLGQLCGHVLAWSQRKQVAYICPMDVVLQHMAETLDASEICLPGGEPVVTRDNDACSDSGVAVSPRLVAATFETAGISSDKGLSREMADPMRFANASFSMLPALTSHLQDLKMSRTQGMGARLMGTAVTAAGQQMLS